MQICVTEHSNGTPADLWSDIGDPASWPLWCAAFTVVQPEGPFAVGTRVRVVQPGLRPAVWTIDEVTPGRSFRWTSDGPGFRSAAEFAVSPGGTGSIVTFSATITGPMGWAAALVSGRLIRHHCRQHARALAARHR